MKTLVVGLGNPILSDDAIGIRVVQAVQEQELAHNSEVEFLEASLGGLSLAEQLAGYDRVILIDAIQTPAGRPGAVYDLTLDDMPTVNADSAHDTSLKAGLEVLRLHGGRVPEHVSIVAIEAVNLTDFGEMLTPAVEAAVPVAVKAVLAKLLTAH